MITSKNFSALLDQYIKAQTFESGPRNLYDPVRYIMEAGGKRIRPLLTLMAADLFDGDPREVLPGAYAVELFHNFSLLHDDIMDEAPLRRGRPSVHIKYGLNSGILSGDVMLVHVYEYLRKIPYPARFAQLIAYFNQAAIEVCEGQQLDVDFETMSIVAESLYLEMIEKKTAALLGAALAIGAIPYASEKEIDLLVKFGRDLGIAFQLRDDLLDSFGDVQKVGKQKGGDILQNKKTILTIQAMVAGKESDKIRLAHWMASGPEDGEKKIKEVTDIYIRSGAKDYTASKIDHYHRQALSHLEKIEVPRERKSPFFQLAEQLMHRES